MSWKQVFYSGHKFWGWWANCQEAAKAAGYPMYEWNGWIYKTDGESMDPSHTALCKAEELK